MGYGGLHPYPRRFGRDDRTRLVFESIARARGTALDALTPGTKVYIETLAIARQVAAVQRTLQRSQNQRHPAKLVDMLPRWESIYGITPTAKATLEERRAAIARIRKHTGEDVTVASLISQLQETLGPVFVALEFISLDKAVLHVPDETYGPGIVIDGFPWVSTVAHVLVRVVRPPNYSAPQFYEAAGKVADVLGPALPAHMTFTWYRAPEKGPAIDVKGGPSAGGFYLDERNLNESVFAR